MQEIRPPRLAAAGTIVIELYRNILKPFMLPSCRFLPSCSQYAEGCLRQHGLLYGIWLSLKRLARCHPFGPGGFDPVP